MQSLGTISLFILFTPFLSQAQFSDSVTHHVRFSAAGNLNRSNNATAYLLTNDARFSIKNKRTTFNSGANWLYGEQGANLTNNDFTANADFNVYRDSSNLYYWGLANYTTSLSLRIQSQLQMGAGAAYNFVNTEKAWLNVSEGILYETSSLNTGAGEKDHYQIVRNSLRLSYKFVLGKGITFNGTNFLQQALSNRNDYIIRTTNAVSLKLNSWISFGTTVTYNQFKVTGTENILVTYGLVAEKYF